MGNQKNVAEDVKPLNWGALFFAVLIVVAIITQLNHPVKEVKKVEINK